MCTLFPASPDRSSTSLLGLGSLPPEVWEHLQAPLSGPDHSVLSLSGKGAVSLPLGQKLHAGRPRAVLTTAVTPTLRSSERDSGKAWE